VLVVFDSNDRGGDAAAVEAHQHGERNDEHLVAEQSPAEVSQVVKHEEAGNTGDQVDDTDCREQPHPCTN